MARAHTCKMHGDMRVHTVMDWHSASRGNVSSSMAANVRRHAASMAVTCTMHAKNRTVVQHRASSAGRQSPGTRCIACGTIVTCVRIHTRAAAWATRWPCLSAHWRVSRRASADGSAWQETHGWQCAPVPAYLQCAADALAVGLRWCADSRERCCCSAVACCIACYANVTGCTQPTACHAAKT